MATIAQNISRIQTAKADLKTAIEAKGVTVPSATTIDGYATLVGQIQTGGGGTISDFAALIDRSITTVSIPSGVTIIGKHAFDECTSLAYATISNGVITIDDYAFCNCDSLTTVTIPNSVTTINQRAFYDCSYLESVTIGSGITSIGANAFNYCNRLASVTILATTPPTLANFAFSSNVSGRKFYVPAESVDAYKAANNWINYAADIEAIPNS